MKVVLINPNNFISKKDYLIQSFVGIVPPFGLFQLVSIIRSSGYDVRFIDQYVECKTHAALLQELIHINPDIVGISVLAPVFEEVKKYPY